MPNVLYALPEIQNNQVVRWGNADFQTRIAATSEVLPQARNWPLARGVFFTRQDSDDYEAVAVLGATVYDELFEEGQDPLGEWLLIGNTPFQVIGVLTRKGSSGGQDQDDTIYVPLKTGALRLFGEKFARQIMVAVDDIDLIDETQEHLRSFMTALHGASKTSASSTAPSCSRPSRPRRTSSGCCSRRSAASRCSSAASAS